MYVRLARTNVEYRLYMRLLDIQILLLGWIGWFLPGKLTRLCVVLGRYCVEPFVLLYLFRSNGLPMLGLLLSGTCSLH